MAQSKIIQAIRGMNDILPQDIVYWQYVEEALRKVAEAYGYEEIRFPLLEKTELFTRSIGEVTDIVEKEMYTFSDRNQDSLTLRPEGTAGCVRAGIQNGLLYNQIQRWYYLGAMFRHERPQKGRFRQFYQFGIEAFGLAGPDIDAEILLMSSRFWQALGVKDKIKLHLNTLGTDEVRRHYRQKLVEYFTAHATLLDDDSQRRLTTNPLRILDSKNPTMFELIKNAPRLADCLDAASKAHFDGLKRLLDAAKLEYVVDPCLVRGLDYYCLTVFEWVTEELGAQGAVCGGGHYDNLVAQLGGKSTPAIGFAIGFERLIELVRKVKEQHSAAHIYMITLGEKALQKGLNLAEELRDALPSWKIIFNCGGGNLAMQLKRADKSLAHLALILGDEELKSEKVIVKWLRSDEARQESVAFSELINFVTIQRYN